MNRKPHDGGRRRSCPCCRRGVLHPTGAFSTCDHCGLAITSQALAYAEAMAREEATKSLSEGETTRIA